MYEHELKRKETTSSFKNDFDEKRFTAAYKKKAQHALDPAKEPNKRSVEAPEEESFIKKIAAKLKKKFRSSEPAAHVPEAATATPRLAEHSPNNGLPEIPEEESFIKKIAAKLKAKPKPSETSAHAEEAVTMSPSLAENRPNKRPLEAPEEENFVENVAPKQQPKPSSSEASTHVQEAVAEIAMTPNLSENESKESSLEVPEEESFEEKIVDKQQPEPAAPESSADVQEAAVSPLRAPEDRNSPLEKSYREAKSHYSRQKEKYIRRQRRMDKRMLRNRFIEFEISYTKDEIRVGSHEFITRLNTKFSGFAWELQPIVVPADKKKEDDDQRDTENLNFYNVCPNSDIKLYNFMYSDLKNNKAIGTKRDLRTYSEEGKIKTLIFKRKSIHGPWAKGTVKIDDTVHEGYVHQSIIYINLKEVVIDSKYSVSNERTVVRANSGAKIYADKGNTFIETAEFNTPLFVNEVELDDWASVIYKGEPAYVNVDYINTGTPMPCAGAELYKVKSDERVDDIVKEKIGNGEEMDRRMYAHVLLHVNNPQNNPEKGIYIEDEFDFLNFLSVDYDRFKTRKDNFIWIPTRSYCEGMKGQVSSGSYTEELKKKLKGMAGQVTGLVDEYWPENWGAYYGADVAATFAYPVGAKSKVETYFYRKDKNTLALKKYDKVAFGLDTGAEAGFYIGRKGSGGKGAAGIGGKVGVNAEAMAAVYGMVEYEFPIKDDDAVVSALGATFLSGNNAILAGGAAVFFDILTGSQLHPMHYMTKSKLAVGAELQASAFSILGAQKAGNDKEREAYSEKGAYSSDKAPDSYSGSIGQAINPLNKDVQVKGLLLKQLSIGMDALVSINPKIGIEFSRELETEEGQTKVASETMEVFLEAGGRLDVGLNLSILGQLGVAFDQGLGIKFVFKTNEAGDWEMSTMSFYATSGEMDYYDGAASESSLDIGTDLKGFAQGIKNMDGSKFADLIKKTQITKRIQLAGFMNAKASKLKNNLQDYKNKVKEGQQAGFLDINAYLDVKMDFSNMSKVDIFKNFSIIEASFPGKNIFEKSMNGYKAFTEWTKGDIPTTNSERIKEFVDNLNSAIDSELIPEVILHIRAGAGFAAGFSAALGAKVKLAGGGAAGVLYEKDVKELLVQYVTSDNAQKLLYQLENNQLSSDLITRFEDIIGFDPKAKPLKTKEE